MFISAMTRTKTSLPAFRRVGEFIRISIHVVLAFAAFEWPISGSSEKQTGRSHQPPEKADPPFG